MRLWLRKAARSAPEPPSCTGNPGKRVIRIESLSRSAKALFPPHNRISCYAALSTAACAAFIEESRMKRVETTELGRKSGKCGGSHLDLTCVYPSSTMCSPRLPIQIQKRQG